MLVIDGAEEGRLPTRPGTGSIRGSQTPENVPQNGTPSRIRADETMKTFMAKPVEIEQRWWLVDASDKVVGRLEIGRAHV